MSMTDVFGLECLLSRSFNKTIGLSLLNLMKKTTFESADFSGNSRLHRDELNPMVVSLQFGTFRIRHFVSFFVCVLTWVVLIAHPRTLLCHWKSHLHTRVKSHVVENLNCHFEHGIALKIKNNMFEKQSFDNNEIFISRITNTHIFEIFLAMPGYLQWKLLKLRSSRFPSRFSCITHHRTPAKLGDRSKK